jgi:GDP-4-dehydro-6-deoxy-D-mannose reductase
MTRPIMVTGATGFVGGHLVARLREAFHDAALVVTSHAGGVAQELDITDIEAVNAHMAAVQPSALVHLAAMSSVPACETDPVAAHQVNVLGTLNLARAVMTHAPGCRFLFVGSSEVYGGSFKSGAALDESALLDPMNVYAATKAAADLLLGQYARRGLVVTRFRPFNHFGPGQSDRFALASFARQIVAAERGEQPPVLETGNLESIRDFLDVRDIVEAYVLAIGRAEPLDPGTILNLASGQPRRIGDILAQMIRMARVPIAIRQSPARARTIEIAIASGEAARARALLNWAPRLAFEETLADVLAWERTSRDAAPRLS